MSDGSNAAVMPNPEPLDNAALLQKIKNLQCRPGTMSAFLRDELTLTDMDNRWAAAKRLLPAVVANRLTSSPRVESVNRMVSELVERARKQQSQRVVQKSPRQIKTGAGPAKTVSTKPPSPKRYDEVEIARMWQVIEKVQQYLCEFTDMLDEVIKQLPPKPVK